MNKQDLEANQSAMVEAITIALAKYGVYKSKVKHHDYIVVINYTEPSYRKRLYVYDLKNKEVIRTHHTTHGINSSDIHNRYQAVRFSNVPNSWRSSLGAMITAETYHGKHGYSLRLDGLEKGVNDNVRSRYIVIHPAPYVTDTYILAANRAGQSHGCPAVDPAISKDLIDLIKGGRFLYAYY